MVSRFAPSTTGESHPGTLLSALLVWLDARARGARVLCRLENLDHTRCKPGWADQMLADLEWLGLDWDEIVDQSQRAADHEAALDRLASAGRLYPCRCTRADRAGGRRAPDGGWAYPNTCRGRTLPPEGWRALYARLGSQARERLRAGGALAVEVGAGQAEEVARLMEDQGLEHRRTVHDLAGIPRVVVATTA